MTPSNSTTPDETSMPTRKLGGQGLEVSALGLGTMGITMAYGEPDEDGGIATIRRAYEMGVTVIDTAEMYGLGAGTSERIVGRAVKGFRDDIQLVTKFGYDFRDPAKFLTTFDSRPEHIREVAHESLRLLDTDYIDVFFQHRVDPKVPIEEVAGAVGELIAEGKVRYFGLCEAGPDTVRRAHAVHPVSVVQTEYSFLERSVADDVLPALRQLGIGFMAYSPLARGFLTSAVTPAAEYPASDWRHSNDDRWQPGNYEANIAATRELTALADSKGATVSQLALAWLLAQGTDIVPIPGTRSPKRLAENLAAVHIDLTVDDLERIDRMLPNGAAGARYNEAMLPVWH
jgi:aryl-alcohol dehydrogenase-like predicted oxidoreductase